MAKVPGLTISSELTRPQGQGRGNYKIEPSILSHTLYSPPKQKEIVHKPEIIFPVYPARPPLAQPEIIIVVREPMLQLPDANKLELIGNGVDEIIWEGLPELTHWVTYQVGVGTSNEYDYEGSYASLTFPASVYYVIISADGYEPRLYTIKGREPLPEEWPVFEEPEFDPNMPLPTPPVFPVFPENPETP